MIPARLYLSDTKASSAPLQRAVPPELRPGRTPSDTGMPPPDRSSPTGNRQRRTHSSAIRAYSRQAAPPFHCAFAVSAETARARKDRESGETKESSAPSRSHRRATRAPAKCARHTQSFSPPRILTIGSAPGRCFADTRSRG